MLSIHTGRQRVIFYYFIFLCMLLISSIALSATGLTFAIKKLFILKADLWIKHEK